MRKETFLNVPVIGTLLLISLATNVYFYFLIWPPPPPPEPIPILPNGVPVTVQARYDHWPYATLKKCSKKDDTIYLVYGGEPDCNCGFVTYYDATGRTFGEVYHDDIHSESTLTRKINLLLYDCTVLEQNPSY